MKLTVVTLKKLRLTQNGEHFISFAVEVGGNMKAQGLLSFIYAINGKLEQKNLVISECFVGL